MNEGYDERRRFHRLDLAHPLEAEFDGLTVRLHEIGLVGAFIDHHAPLEPDRIGILSFAWGNDRLQFECRVVHSRAEAPEGGRFSSGLDVRAALGESAAMLRRMIAEHVARVVAAQEANAFGLRDLNRIDGDATLTALGSARRTAQTGFINYRLISGAWKKVPSLLPDQPADGFTVAAWEEDEQLDSLRKAYEQADEEGRSFLRMLAELSISEATGIPPRRPD
ncbi:MAG: hypothetical protein LC732_01085 [Acidobacteria bacterium]|nr:hypothetical protein [Acidobacteriota bacterium]